MSILFLILALVSKDRLVKRVRRKVADEQLLSLLNNGTISDKQAYMSELSVGVSDEPGVSIISYWIDIPWKGYRKKDFMPFWRYCSEHNLGMESHELMHYIYNKSEEICMLKRLPSDKWELWVGQRLRMSIVL